MAVSTVAVPNKAQKMRLRECHRDCNGLPEHKLEMRYDSKGLAL